MAQPYLSNNDTDRRAAYAKYTKVFESCHKEVFAADVMALTPGDRKKYIVANLAALISKASADLLFGEPLKIKAEGDALANLLAISENSGFDSLLWELALSTSYLGDGFLKARFDPEIGAIIEYVDPALVQIVTNPDNANEIEKFVISWKRTIGGREFLRRETREWGVITNQLFILDGEKVGAEVDLAAAYPAGEAPEAVQMTGVDGFLMVHIPNFKSSSAKVYGRSDYAELEGLFSEINNRVTRDANILDKHSNPKLAVPPGVLDKDGKVRRESFDMFEVASAASGIQKPEYITWDGNLEASNTHFERVLKLVWLVSETSPDLFGFGQGGPESGRALRLRIQRTLAKIARKKRYFAAALKEIIAEASVLQATLNGFSTVEDFALEFQDGLPTDYRDDAETREIEMRSGTVSLETAVKERNPDWSEEQVAEEIARIKEDHALVTSSGSAPSITDFSNAVDGAAA